MELGILIAIILIFIAILALFWIVLKKNNRGENSDDRFARLASEALKSNNQQFLTLAEQVLKSKTTEMQTDLEGKKSAINDLINEIRKDIRKNEERLAKSDADRLSSFSSLQNELKTYKEITGELKVSTDKLKELLSNNQMRGAFGEKVADDLLKMAGFVVGQDYCRNETQQTNSSRPDFTIFLPDQTRINIDVKFPYASLVKYAESEEKSEKERHLREFRQAVKDKIKQVSTREYINPQEKTVDFVVLFIPNEMIFSFIYDKMNDIWEDAMRKKVILTGPFSFTAILRMVRQAYSNFNYQKNLHKIVGLIQRFDIEYQKYSEEVDRLGMRIESTSKQFDTVSKTRDRALTTIVSNIKAEQPSIGEPKEEANESPKLINEPQLYKRNINIENDEQHDQ